MRLLHYASKPVERVNSVDQEPRHRSATLFKPRGLWVSVEGEDDWLTWCLSEGFAPQNLAFVHEIVLSPSARLIHLSGADQIDEFTRAYGLTDLASYGLSGLAQGYAIDWCRLADEYQGIIIAPYVWERRLKGGARWYYPWDCASGCIWDAAAVDAIKLLDFPPPSDGTA